MKRPDARTLLFERIRTSPPKFVHVTGVPYTVEVEVCSDVTRIDHLWITMETPPFGRLRAVINTTSRINRDAGFDARVRVGVVASTWSEKPQTGLVEERGQDYGPIEATTAVAYEAHERDALAELLLVKIRASVRVEVWGELYASDHLGIHQIHSRRASSAVPQDLRSRDGALKLYYPDNSAELFLFKFSGQT